MTSSRESIRYIYTFTRKRDNDDDDDSKTMEFVVLIEFSFIYLSFIYTAELGQRWIIEVVETDGSQKDSIIVNSTNPEDGE